MDRVRRYCACWLVLAATGTFVSGAAADGEFPFGRELILDTNPMRGSKRIPILEIAENGAASIDLWCARLQGQATVAADAITILPGAASPEPCPADRAQRDEELLTTLSQVTSWRRRGDVVELRGANTLRFRLMTN